MNREYIKHYSHELGRDMESLVFGHAGQPILVFPTSMGRFFEYEDAGMIRALEWKIDQGALQVFCVDGVDSESWYNKSVHPGARIWRHVQYERYILNEFVAVLKWKNWAPQIAVTGCSFGGYHALNFSLRHPDLVSRLRHHERLVRHQKLSRRLLRRQRLFQQSARLSVESERRLVPKPLRQMKIVLGSSDWDMCLDANVKMAAILSAKGIPHWLDIYGDNSKHDWPLWQRMAEKYF